jgi:hypothetical protein
MYPDPLEVHACQEADFADFVRIQIAAFGMCSPFDVLWDMS